MKPTRTKQYFSVILTALIVINIFTDVLWFSAPAYATPEPFVVESSYPGGVRGGEGSYNKDANLTPTNSTVDVHSYVTDPAKQAQITSVKIVDFSGAEVGTCTTTECTVGAQTGVEKSIESGQFQRGGPFDWWRNFEGGATAFYWSYDNADGVTKYSTQNGGLGTDECDPDVSGHSPCPRRWPGGTYEEQWKFDGTSGAYTFVDDGTPADLSYSKLTEVFNLVPSGSANPNPTADPVIDSTTGEMTFAFKTMDFISGGDDIQVPTGNYGPSNVRGISWSYDGWS